MRLKARFLRFCHLLRHFPMHRAYSYTLNTERSGLFYRHIGCDCGREW